MRALRDAYVTNHPDMPSVHDVEVDLVIRDAPGRTEPLTVQIRDINGALDFAIVELPTAKLQVTTTAEIAKELLMGGDKALLTSAMFSGKIQTKGNFFALGGVLKQCSEALPKELAMQMRADTE